MHVCLCVSICLIVCVVVVCVCRAPRSFLGCSALMTSHIEDADADSVDADAEADGASEDESDGPYASEDANKLEDVLHQDVLMPEDCAALAAATGSGGVVVEETAAVVMAARTQDKDVRNGGTGAVEQSELANMCEKSNSVTMRPSQVVSTNNLAATEPEEHSPRADDERSILQASYTPLQTPEAICSSTMLRQGQVVLTSPDGKECAAGAVTVVPQQDASSSDFHSLVSAVNGVRGDISRMADILLSAQPEDDRLRVPQNLTVADKNALRLLASDMKRQSSIVHQLSMSVATASDGGPLPNQAELLKSLSSLLLQAKWQLECISPHLQAGENAAPPMTEPAHMAARDFAAHPNHWFSNAANSAVPVAETHGQQWPVVTQQKDGLLHGLQNVTLHVVSSNENENIHQNGDDANEIGLVRKCTSQDLPHALLQAALREVLESSLLDVDAQISEWQELKNHIPIVDTSSATLEDWKPAPLTHSRAPEIGDLSSVYISFEPLKAASAPCTQSMSPATHDMPHTNPTENMSKASHAGFVAGGNSGGHSRAVESTNHEAVPAVGERYNDFVDARMQYRVMLAENLRLKTIAQTAARAPVTSESSSHDASGVEGGMPCENRLLEEYMQLSAEMEECMSQLPLVMLAVSNSRATNKPPSATIPDQTPAGLDTMKDSIARNKSVAGSGTPAVNFNARTAHGRFCSSQDRAAMAEKLAKRDVFCSPLDRVALAQRLAAKAALAELPTTSLSPPVSFPSQLDIHQQPRHQQHVSSTSIDSSPDDRLTLEVNTLLDKTSVVVFDCNVQKVQCMHDEAEEAHVLHTRACTQVPAPLNVGAMASARLEIDGQIRANTEMLHAQLERVTLELSAASSDVSELVACSTSAAADASIKCVSSSHFSRPQSVPSRPHENGKDLFDNAPSSSVTPARAVNMLERASQTSAMEPCHYQVGVNTSLVETVGVAVGVEVPDTSREFVMSEHNAHVSRDTDSMALSSHEYAASDELCVQLNLQHGWRKNLPRRAGDGGGGGGAIQDAQMLDVLREANEGVLDISRLAMQLSLHLSSRQDDTVLHAPAGAHCGNSLAHVCALEKSAATACSPLLSSSLACAHATLTPLEVRGSNGSEAVQDVSNSPAEPSCAGRDEERTILDGRPEGYGKVYGDVLVSVESVTAQVRVITDMQASASHGNQLLLEKTDELSEHVQLRLGELEKGQGSIQTAVSELNCHLSQVHAHVTAHINNLTARSSAVAPEGRLDLVSSNAGTQTQTQAQTQTDVVGGDAEADTTKRQKPSTLQGTSSLDNCTCLHAHKATAVATAASAPAPAALEDLQGLVKELQHVAAEIKSSQHSQAQQLQLQQSAQVAARETVVDAPCHNQAIAPKMGGVTTRDMCQSRAQRALISSSLERQDGRNRARERERVQGYSSEALDLSELTEMHEILSMLRQRATAKAHGDGTRAHYAETELDLSAFPHGPVAEGWCSYQKNA